jgi:DNA-binding SARP family transcriptional activator/Flp pilus assembly protein TadD
VDGRTGTTLIPAAKQRVLLAALALRAGHVVSYDDLAEAAWHADASKTARVTVRNYVLRLRRALGEDGPRIVTRDPGYLLDVGLDEVDVTAFGELCAAGGALARAGRWSQAGETLSQALGMWRGTPLADVPSPTLQDQWIGHLDQARLGALRQRIRADLCLGRHETVVGELRALTAVHRLDEELWALLLLASYRSGFQGDALAAYRQAREALIADLGVEPGPSLSRLHRQILAHDPALELPSGQEAPQPPGTQVPRQLPAPLPVFAGRARELGILQDLLDAARDGAAMVVAAIGGTAGVGKTTLAVHFAHRVAGRFPDGQLYVNLRGFDPSGEPITPGQVIRAFLDALGVPPDGVPKDLDAQSALYRSLLAGKRILVLLDNARSAAQVRPLLPGSPGCVVLVTSRDSLASLAVTDGARLLGLELLTEAEGRDLLKARLGAAAVEADPAAAAELSGLCARLPLALAVAASRAAVRPGLSLRSLAAELHGENDLLGSLDAGEEPASVRAVFSWSYRQLPAAAARMFRLLGAHPGPDITIAAAASLAGMPADLCRAALRDLATVGLLAEHVPGRYAFHDLLRAYSAELAGGAEQNEERRAAVRRVLDHYLSTAHAAALRLRPLRDPIVLPPPCPGVAPVPLEDRQQAMAWLTAEQQVLLAAIGFAGSEGWDAHAWQLTWAMADFLKWRGQWHENAALQRLALAAAIRLGDVTGQAEIHQLLANTNVALGDYDRATGHLADCLGQYRQLGDQLGVARVHMTLSVVAAERGDHGTALRYAEKGLELFQAAHHEAGQAMALNNIGWCHTQLGDHEQAREFGRRAVTLQATLGTANPQGHAAAWDSLGYAEYKFGNYDAAIDCYLNALRISEDVGDRHLEAEFRTHLGDAYQKAGDTPAARRAWRQALDILTDLDHPDAAEVRDRLAQRFQESSTNP